MFCNNYLLLIFFIVIVSKASEYTNIKMDCNNISTYFAFLMLFLEIFTARNKPYSLCKVHGNVRFILSKEGAHIYDCKQDAIT